jgi:hypothetical protein
MSNVNQKTGEVSWNETIFDPSAKKNSKDTFLRLGPGSNIVRLLTLPHQYYQHKYSVPGGKRFGYRINCAGTNNGACPLCEKNDKAKRRWFLGVIDRKTNTYKILDIGYSVFKDIQNHAKDDDWGDPSKYDIDIVVDPNGGSTGYYTVVAKPPKPLSAGDLVIQEDNSSEELAQKVIPPTPEKVQERLDRIMEEITSQGGNLASADSSNTDSSDDEDGRNYFKNYDSGTSKKVPF